MPHKDRKSYRLYHVWYNMKKRCEDHKHDAFASYGGRGIKVGPEWAVSSDFIQWALENGYEEGLTLDRRDNNGDYGPLNCQFSTPLQQGRNKRNNAKFEWQGELRTIPELAEMAGMDRVQMWVRLVLQGWKVEPAMTIPVSRSNTNLRGVKVSE